MDVSRKSLLLQAVLIVGVVVTGLTLVVIPLLGHGGLEVAGSALWHPLGEPLNVPARLTFPAVEGLRPGLYQAGEAVELSGPTVVTASAYNPTLPQRLALVGGDVIAGLAAVAVLVLLLRITRTVPRDVFVAQNARRLHAVAALVLLGGMASQVLRVAGAASLLAADTVKDRVDPVLEVSYLPVAVALGVVVLAEVFRQGVALREDVEGLV